MHKITKGLKKKKKGKKSKHKDEELFKPEELEAYRREHQQHQQVVEESAAAAAEASSAAPAVPGQNEEWKKFIALTSGVDDILKKTQGDLDRIKSTSFFQRVPPPSEVKRQQEKEARREEEAAAAHQKRVASSQPAEVEEQVRPADIGIVQVSESESEEDDEDDIFDTAYIDAIAAGEVKLAYIPESPTEPQTGDDPFDTSYAERAILGPVVERKGKKLVPIGAAVEVLTGRVQIPTCATQRPQRNRRQILKERDLLLGSFDADGVGALPASAASPVEVKRTLLDDDEPIPLADEPIDLSKNLAPPPPPETVATPKTEPKLNLDEFDVINKNEIEDEDDEDFALLAAESLTKAPPPVVNSVTTVAPPLTVAPDVNNWAAFDASESSDALQQEVEVDPFDTAFAENILPGKAELKVIEDEILNKDFQQPRIDDKITRIVSKVSIKVTDPAGQRESISSLDRVSESDLNLIKPIHRDLLGGSNTDLSNLNDQPLRPAEQIDDNYIEYSDPFDTSIVETAKLPGHTELKFLEKELLGDIEKKVSPPPVSDDEEFDPRADEVVVQPRLSRPDVLNINATKTVSFDLPSSPDDLLGAGEEAAPKKPLTPFYVRKQSIPEEPAIEDDPFDTSFVIDTGPGKAELKQIESELFDPEVTRRLSLSDQDFDPRNDAKTKVAQVVLSIQNINNKKPEPVDLLGVGHDDVSVKVLTPASGANEEIAYSDPFDTSIATNIAPGRTELRLLETELIHSFGDDSDFDPRRVDLLDPSSTDFVSDIPLNPVCEENVDIDPFDTSIANNIVPGKTELKLLESELI